MAASASAEGVSLGERCCVITTAENRRIRNLIAISEGKSVSKFNRSPVQIGAVEKAVRTY
jgi:hypothetical protein